MVPNVASIKLLLMSIIFQIVKYTSFSTMNINLCKLTAEDTVEATKDLAAEAVSLEASYTIVAITVGATKFMTKPKKKITISINLKVWRVAGFKEVCNKLYVAIEL
ncbi:hypothetical protein TNCT_711191 [Trichonephila clavata]|uniref:Uncharacterized protein n=1 Tax=Trichonephila clavata TaxID=2740835 RepID=A0A8X6KTQ1_TRICU|nr:hypothetical protein TNCT_711191 [Trichonephila clavata]